MTVIDPAIPSGSPTESPAGPVVAVGRRTIDRVLISLGAVISVVLLVAGGLLTWGNNFAEDYVHDELSSQNIFFPSADQLNQEGRTDLLKYAGEQVTTGAHAEAYASYIDHHLQDIAGGQTYADLGGPERAAKAAVTEATASGADSATVAELQGKASALTGQRDSLFRGETLRGLLLTAFAWATIGRIAGIAATAAFLAAATMIVLVVLGLVHIRRAHRASHTPA